MLAKCTEKEARNAVLLCLLWNC